MLGNLSGDLAKFEKNVQANVTMHGVASMAKVIYEEARARAPVSDHAHTFYGHNSAKTGVTYTFQPGNLRDSIYRAYSEKLSSDTKKVYRVTWNHQKAPYGFMVEFGTSRAAAHPFMRPAFESSISRSLDEAKARMAARLKEIAVKS
jgi:HK97 gp10 family phage protein